MEALQPVTGKVIPVLMPGIKLNQKDSNSSTRDNKEMLAFLTGSSTGYILSSEKTYKRAFPALAGTLCWGAGKTICPRKASFDTIMNLMYFNSYTPVPLWYQMRTNSPAVFHWSLCHADKGVCVFL